MARVDVRKTYKLFIGGQFPRSESGYSYVVEDSRGRFVANAAKASRKDARDAVVAARAAVKDWSGRTAYNRGQIIYRVAEIMEDRYVLNRLQSPEQRARLLDRPEILQAVGSDMAEAAKATVTAPAES